MAHARHHSEPSRLKDCFDSHGRLEYADANGEMLTTAGRVRLRRRRQGLRRHQAGRLGIQQELKYEFHVVVLDL